MATELLAAGVLVFQQANAGASVERQIAVALGVIGILTFSWAVARFILKPLLNGWVFAVLADKPAALTDTVIEGLDKNDRTRATTRGFLDRLYTDVVKQRQELRDIVEANRDRITFVEESNARQGEALTKEIGRAMEHMARATDAQTRIMERIQKELEGHSIIIARLDERIQQWDGNDRRRNPR